MYLLSIFVCANDDFVYQLDLYVYDKVFSSTFSCLDKVICFSTTKMNKIKKKTFSF